MTNTKNNELVMGIIHEWAKDIVRVERLLRTIAETIEENDMDKELAQKYTKTQVKHNIPEHARGIERVLHQHKRIYVQALKTNKFKNAHKNTSASYIDFIATIIRNQATPYANHFKHKMERVVITPSLTRTLLTTKYIVRCNGILMSAEKQTA